jgi:hypothetical protein
MKNFFREAADWTSEALETACGWALYVAIAYAVFFVDFTGRGPVWSHVASMWREGRPAPAVAKHEGVRVIKLGAPSEKRDDGVGLVAQLDYKYLTGQREEEKAVVGVNHDRRVEMTDAPADLEASSKKDWKRSLQGELRTFAVYGNGEQTSSASSGGQAAYKAPAREQALAANAAVPQSAYAAGADSPTARPAISGRARALSQNGSDSVRNFK